MFRAILIPQGRKRKGMLEVNVRCEHLWSDVGAMLFSDFVSIVANCISGFVKTEI
jgi:hypothetical protein